MKSKALKLCTVFLLLFFIGASCQKDEDLFEIQIGDESAVIQKVVNGIEFKFCLMNEQGDPTTIFDEDENFTFQFTIKNNTGESIIFHDYSFYEDSDFFSVNNRTQNFGRPFELLKEYLNSGEMRYIHNDMSSSFICPWQDSRDNFFAMHGTFRGLNKMTLENGRYVTSFTHNFHFGDIETGSLTFKINFEIK